MGETVVEKGETAVEDGGDCSGGGETEDGGDCSGGWGRL